MESNSNTKLPVFGKELAPGTMIRWPSKVIPEGFVVADRSQVLKNNYYQLYRNGKDRLTEFTDHFLLPVGEHEYKIIPTPTDEFWVSGKRIYTVAIPVTLPNATTLNTTLDDYGISSVISISGYANNGTIHIPLPYSDTGGDNVEVLLTTTTNLRIITTVNLSTYSGYVILKFTKKQDVEYYNWIVKV